MAKDINRQIEERIQQFVSELNSLVRQAALEAVNDALGGQSRGGRFATPAAPASGARRTARRIGGRGRRSSRQLEQTMAALRDFVAQNPGARMEHISAGLGMSTQQLRRPVDKLLKAGELRKRGEKRATEYFVGSGGGSGAGRAAPSRKRSGAKKKTTKKRATRKKKGAGRKGTSSRRKR